MPQEDDVIQMDYFHEFINWEPSTHAVLVFSWTSRTTRMKVPHRYITF